MPEPRTKAGKALLEREAYNSRSFTLIDPDAIAAIEREAADLALVALKAAIFDLPIGMSVDYSRGYSASIAAVLRDITDAMSPKP